ncbi:MAG: hypothetical protein LBH81_00400 [Rickettsiales bacterium]|jgi:hypothetical protein|nr:hypothetical protein [Rickettsiales bacterium]
MADIAIIKTKQDLKDAYNAWHNAEGAGRAFIAKISPYADKDLFIGFEPESKESGDEFIKVLQRNTEIGNREPGEIQRDLGAFRHFVEKKKEVADYLWYVDSLFAELDKFLGESDADREMGLYYRNKFIPDAYEEFFKGNISAVQLPKPWENGPKWPWPFKSDKRAREKDFHGDVDFRLALLKKADAEKPKYDIVMPKLTEGEYYNIGNYIAKYREVMDTELNYANAAVMGTKLQKILKEIDETAERIESFAELARAENSRPPQVVVREKSSSSSMDGSQFVGAPPSSSSVGNFSLSSSSSVDYKNTIGRLEIKKIAEEKMLPMPVTFAIPSQKKEI